MILYKIWKTDSESDVTYLDEFVLVNNENEFIEYVKENIIDKEEIDYILECQGELSLSQDRPDNYIGEEVISWEKVSGVNSIKDCEDLVIQTFLVNKVK